MDLENYAKTKPCDCIHINLCKVIFSDIPSKNKTPHTASNYVEVLKKEKVIIALVHPVQDKKGRLPGIVVLNSRTTKPKCQTCSGKKCVHVNIYIEEAKNEGLPAKKLDAIKQPSNNPLDPSDRRGKASNVFGVKIDFPPQKSEKAEIDRINKVDNLFPSGYIVPKIEPGELCSCEPGFPYIPNIQLGNVESTNVHIHHSKQTKDSRNSTLVLLYRTTSKCSCRKHYTGEEDKLLRISAVATTANRKTGSGSPIQFISYDFLFEYNASLMSGGTTQFAFVQSKNDVNVIYRGHDIELPEKSLRKGYEIFIHSLNYNKEEAWDCKKCPDQLKPGESEEQFDEIECHISDGINMGTIENDIKGFTDKDTFEEEIDTSAGAVKGIEAKERTYIKTAKHRNILKSLSTSSCNITDVKKAITQLSKCEKVTNIDLVRSLLTFLTKKKSSIPEPYRVLISELGKCTPISVLLPSHDKLDYRLLKAYLDEKHDIFEEYSVTEKITNAFPLLIRIIRTIVRLENCVFLPAPVRDIIATMIDLKETYTQMARKRAVPRKAPLGNPVEAEVYPYFPAHTVNHEYEADGKVDKNEDDGCSKDYNECATFTGGITHITCSHSIVKGFTAMKRGESVRMIVNPCVTRLPQRVQAKRRFLLYDNACQARAYAERRYPHRVRHWTFLVDRKHWDNHTTCSQAYCMDEYPLLKHINSQVSEQTNRSLRKLSVVLAYYGWDNYLKILELFFVIRNLRIKNMLC